jgi:hypothetical protein
MKISIPLYRRIWSEGEIFLVDGELRGNIRVVAEQHNGETCVVRKADNVVVTIKDEE